MLTWSLNIGRAACTPPAQQEWSPYSRPVHGLRYAPGAALGWKRLCEYTALQLSRNLWTWLDADVFRRAGSPPSTLLSYNLTRASEQT